MQYVLDTNVVSALRVRGRNPQVEAWAAAVPVSDMFVTAPTMAEIERGVVAKERSDPLQGEILRRWFEDHVLPAFADRVLPFDLPAARILATYRVPEHAPLDDDLSHLDDRTTHASALARGIFRASVRAAKFRAKVGVS